VKAIIKLSTLILMFFVLATLLIAQESAEELSKEAANPLADLISFPFQNNANFGMGSYDRTTNVLNIQPVIPFAKGKIVTRTIIPIVWIPDFTAESGMHSSGLGDILLTAFWVPESQGAMWGIGPVLEVPTGGENRGSQKWSVGPSALILVQPGNWTIGALINNVWSVAGNSDAENVNHMLFQYFIVYQLGGGLYVNSAPIINVDWTAPDGQQWIVPFGAGVGQLFFMGKLPVNAQIGAYYNVVKPDFGPDWQFRIQIQFLLPISIFKGGE